MPRPTDIARAVDALERIAKAPEEQNVIAREQNVIAREQNVISKVLAGGDLLGQMVGTELFGRMGGRDTPTMSESPMPPSHRHRPTGREAVVLSEEQGHPLLGPEAVHYSGFFSDGQEFAFAPSTDFDPL
jgi:hypothetical protein